MSFYINDDGEIIGSVKKAWSTTLESGEKVKINRTIVLDGLDVNNACDMICRTLIISRQKNERMVDNADLEEMNGTEIHFSEMGRKIVSRAQRMAEIKNLASGMSEAEKAEMRELLGM